MIVRPLLFAMALSIPMPALAHYCPERPGLGIPPCVMEAGRLSVEVSGADWTRERSPGEVADRALIGDTLLRYGFADHAEIQVGGAPYGRVRTRDTTGTMVERMSGSGDMDIGLKRNIVNPAGDKFSVALLFVVGLPTGGKAIGKGDWGASLFVPVHMPVSKVVTLTFNTELDAAVDEDRRGRHIAYGITGGLAVEPADGLTIDIEAQWVRDHDPMGDTVQALAGLSAAFAINENLHVDIGCAVALNADTPDERAYFGLSRRF